MQQIAKKADTSLVNAKVANVLSLAGGTMTGAVAIGPARLDTTGFGKFDSIYSRSWGNLPGSAADSSIFATHYYVATHAGGATDTTSLSLRINTKYGASDTSSILSTKYYAGLALAGRIPYTDTALASWVSRLTLNGLLDGKLANADSSDHATRTYVSQIAAGKLANADSTDRATRTYVGQIAAGKLANADSADKATRTYVSAVALGKLANADSTDKATRTYVSAIALGKLANADSTDKATRTYVTAIAAGKLANADSTDKATRTYVTAVAVGKLANADSTDKATRTYVGAYVTANGGTFKGWYTNGGALVTDTLRFIQGANATLTQSGRTLTIAGTSANVDSIRHLWVDTVGRLQSAKWMTVVANGDSGKYVQKEMFAFDSTGAAAKTSTSGKVYFDASAKTLKVGTDNNSDTTNMATRLYAQQIGTLDTSGFGAAIGARQAPLVIGSVAFSGTNARVAKYIAGVTTSSFFVASSLSANGTTVPILSYYVQVYLKTDSLIFIRSLTSPLSGMTVMYIGQK